ncbi:hypothetical protein CA85_44190 [Allorhodopirellula solitaria]|uniref:Uncharacterized protein n=1 Tax=Allorhodopirellula solitaria TaxID=2527987 RepID=A0A5C5WZQ2_9BACT|nr:hypothetical protein CA85_44190 [Allorhodopirellula solitaria]
MIVQKCVPDEQTLARERQHHWRTAFAGKRWRPRYPLPSPHLCRARLRFSRKCQSNIDNHIPQINPSILEPCLENLGRTLPSDEPRLGNPHDDSRALLGDYSHGFSDVDIVALADHIDQHVVDLDASPRSQR